MGAHASPKPHPSTQRLLADLQLVDVLRIDLGLDREIVRPRHHHHDGVAGIVPPGEQRVIVQDVTFAVEAGTGVGVIGPSGSGKSSSAPSDPIAEIRPVGDQPVTRSPRRRARHAQTRQRSNTANYVKHAERHGRLPTSATEVLILVACRVNSVRNARGL